MICVIRAMLNASCVTLGVYTTEIYPTNIRSMGLGFQLSISRFATSFQPFITEMTELTSLYLPIVLLATSCMLTSIAVWLLPVDTKERPLQNSSGEAIDGLECRGVYKLLNDEAEKHQQVDHMSGE